MASKEKSFEDLVKEALGASGGKGAHFRDATHMAADVDVALVQICAEHGKVDAASAKTFVKDLRAQHRYQTDVY